ncbi:hypothetical protein BT69DRAFT_1126617 [Atractiella rhizophila]|nr:hypothetical protein BT69DRAFT_1126617 [Atractiella rhizophila]
MEFYPAPQARCPACQPPARCPRCPPQPAASFPPVSPLHTRAPPFTSPHRRSFPQHVPPPVIPLAAPRPAYMCASLLPPGKRGGGRRCPNRVLQPDGFCEAHQSQAFSSFSPHDGGHQARTAHLRPPLQPHPSLNSNNGTRSVEGRINQEFVEWSKSEFNAYDRRREALERQSSNPNLREKEKMERDREAELEKELTRLALKRQALERMQQQRALEAEERAVQARLKMKREEFARMELEELMEREREAEIAKRDLDRMETLRRVHAEEARIKRERVERELRQKMQQNEKERHDQWERKEREKVVDALSDEDDELEEREEDSIHEAERERKRREDVRRVEEQRRREQQARAGRERSSADLEKLKRLKEEMERLKIEAELLRLKVELERGKQTSGHGETKEEEEQWRVLEEWVNGLKPPPPHETPASSSREKTTRPPNPPRGSFRVRVPPGGTSRGGATGRNTGRGRGKEDHPLPRSASNPQLRNSGVSPSTEPNGRPSSHPGPANLSRGASAPSAIPTQDPNMSTTESAKEERERLIPRRGENFEQLLGRYIDFLSRPLHVSGEKMHFFEVPWPIEKRYTTPNSVVPSDITALAVVQFLERANGY